MLPPPATSVSIVSFLDALRQGRLINAAQWDEIQTQLLPRYVEPALLADQLLDRGWLTSFQAERLLLDRGNELFVGTYLLQDCLGRDRTGVVYKARHRIMTREVALKLIHAELLTDPEVVQRFYRETEAVSQLAHPNIVHAYDAGPMSGGHVLVMEYVDGVDLEELVRKTGPLPIEQAREYIRQAACGLAHAHEKGLVHGDVKPANLLVSVVRSPSSVVQDGKPPAADHGPRAADNGQIKLLDLGVARLQRNASGDLAGSVDYLAPELADSSHDGDGRADVYSLGCTFFFLLTGRPPFPDGNVTQKLLLHREAEPPAIESLRPDLPAELAVVLRRMMAKRPEDRYPTAGAVVAALAGGQAESPAAETAPSADGAEPRDAEPTALCQSASEPPPAPTVQHPLVLLGGLGLTLVLAGVLVMVFLVDNRASTGRALDPTISDPVVVEVRADQPWQDTHVDVEAGVVITVEATGKWKGGPAAVECGANGSDTASHDRNLVLQAESMRLLGRIGSGPAVVLGADPTFTPRHSGRLFVQANDSDPTGNSGALTVTIRGGRHSAKAVPATPLRPDGVVSGNVALASNGTTVVGAGANLEHLIDGVTTGYDPLNAFAHAPFPSEWTVMLPRIYLLREVRLLLWDGDDRAYRYQLETSLDGGTFVPLADRSAGQWRSWQTIPFAPRAVRFIRIKGLFNSKNDGFHVVELEAYCVPPEQTAVPKYRSDP